MDLLSSSIIDGPARQVILGENVYNLKQQFNNSTVISPCKVKIEPNIMQTIEGKIKTKVKEIPELDVIFEPKQSRGYLLTNSVNTIIKDNNTIYILINVCNITDNKKMREIRNNTHSTTCLCNTLESHNKT